MNKLNIKLLYKVSLFFLCAWMLASLSCNKNNTTQVDNGSITLTVEDASCIEAWLNVKIKDMTLPQRLSLFENDSLKTNLILTSADTTIFTENLLPKKNYKWQLRGEKEKSNEAAVVTMDTTSHNFTWQEFTIGDWQSYLTDVWGTDENNVYAVGSISLNGEHYGALHYDGIQWSVVNDTIGGYAIFGFNANDIWVVGGGVFHFDGVKWKQVDSYSKNHQAYPLDSVLFDNLPYTSLWGTSSSNMYFGNQWGRIIHWDGKKGTLVHDVNAFITEIEGNTIGDIWITAINFNYNNQSIILKKSISGWEAISTNYSSNIAPQSIRFINKYKAIIAGNFIGKYLNGRWYAGSNTKAVMEKVSKNSRHNNILVCGHFFEIRHYNGIQWKELEEFYSWNGGVFRSAILFGNKNFIVGMSDQEKAIIIILQNL